MVLRATCTLLYAGRALIVMDQQWVEFLVYVLKVPFHSDFMPVGGGVRGELDHVVHQGLQLRRPGSRRLLLRGRVRGPDSGWGYRTFPQLSSQPTRPTSAQESQ